MCGMPAAADGSMERVHKHKSHLPLYCVIVTWVVVSHLHSDIPRRHVHRCPLLRCGCVTVAHCVIVLDNKVTSSESLRCPGAWQQSDRFPHPHGWHTLAFIQCWFRQYAEWKSCGGQETSTHLLRQSSEAGQEAPASATCEAGGLKPKVQRKPQKNPRRQEHEMSHRKLQAMSGASPRQRLCGLQPARPRRRRAAQVLLELTSHCHRPDASCEATEFSVCPTGFQSLV